MMHLKCDEYIDELIDQIQSLQDQIDHVNEENARLHHENKSYKMWMDRSIAKIKEMQV